MFNKTSIAKRTSLTNITPKKFRKTLNIKRNIKLKNILENSNKNENSSENNSNINIKTAAQSKIGSESNSIRPIQTNPYHKIKKSFVFDEKEKETYKNKKRISSYFYRNIKNKDSLGSNKVSNSIRNSLIFGKNDGNKNKEKMNNIKNEFIQVEESNNNYANDYLRIMQKNKKIDKLAKKLSLKLNEDEYYGRNKTINNCGANNIIFKNGFFNGTNIIMNPEDNEKIESSTTNNQIDKININQIKFNNYSTANNNTYILRRSKIRGSTLLPLYLRDKANIQGTEVLSPFCKGARDEFLFYKIFNSGLRRKIPKRFQLIDNKLNIFYSENEAQYDKILKKHNDKQKFKGKKILHDIGPSKDQIKLDKIITTVNFMKKIIDYTYPIMVLSKVRNTRTIKDKKIIDEMKIAPYKRAQLSEKFRNQILEQYLKMSIDVKKN